MDTGQQEDSGRGGRPSPLPGGRKQVGSYSRDPGSGGRSREQGAKGPRGGPGPYWTDGHLGSACHPWGEGRHRQPLKIVHVPSLERLLPDLSKINDVSIFFFKKPTGM